MCIAIYKPAGAWASKEYLRNSYNANPDGAGYAWYDGTTVQMKKGFFSWRSFWKSYKRHVTAETPAFIHFRIMTKGSKTAENCHPFAMEHGVLMHNGPCLNYRYCSGDGDRSDSKQFAEDFIDGMESWQVERIQPMIESFAGTEKIAMMFNNGEVIICNEIYGNWTEGCWWSNYSFKGKGMRYGTSSATNLVPRSPGSLVQHDDDFDYDNWWKNRDPSWPLEPLKRTTTTAQPAGAPKGLYQCVYSHALGTYVAREINVHGERYKWDEDLIAYVMPGTSLEAVIEVGTGDVYDIDPDTGQWAPVGYSFTDIEDLKLFMSTSEVTPPEFDDSVESGTASAAVH